MPSDAPSAISQWTPRRVMQGTLLVMAIGLGFWLLYANRIALFSLFAAIVLSTAISPAGDWLHRRGMPRPAGAVVISLGLPIALPFGAGGWAV